MDFYLTIRDGQVVVMDLREATKSRTVITNADEYNLYFQAKADIAGVAVAELDIMSSSALDFPEEHTESANVKALCAVLRGAGR